MQKIRDYFYPDNSLYVMWHADNDSAITDFDRDVLLV